MGLGRCATGLFDGNQEVYVRDLKNTVQSVDGVFYHP